MKLATSLFFLVLSFNLFAQPQVPKDYFSNPLEIPLVLSGTFGELRSNHFHGGLDIKTQHRQGLHVLAAASGYVSRIKIQHYGYGKALYVQHPNGYTTVYGHLQKLGPELEAYLKKAQYAKESYEIELFPEPGELKVEKGQLIAYSGNTGGSGGPHLHFEIRDGNQRPMNPKLFGIEIKDSREPLIQGLFAYPLNKDAQINNSRERQKLKLMPLQDGSYTTSEVEACGNIGFGVVSVDQQDGANNHNGVYKVEANLNGDKVFEIDFNRFSFSESRNLNQLIDYEYYANNRKRIQKLFKNSNNPLSLYNNLVNEGKLFIKDGMDYQYNIKVSDFSGNEKIIRIPIKGTASHTLPEKQEITTPYLATAAKGFSLKNQGIDVYIPAGSLYNDVYLDIDFKGDTLQLHHDDVPLDKNLTIGFNVAKYSAEDREQLFIARIADNGRPIYSTTYKKADRFTTGTRTFGNYTLVADITPPKVEPVNFYDGQWISNNETLKVKISDDLSGIKNYRATINGKFILMEYEYKNHTLTYKFEDSVISETENNLELRVLDNVGNTTTYTAKFFRK